MVRLSLGIPSTSPTAYLRYGTGGGGRIGRIEGLGFQLRTEAVLPILTEDVLKSSENEGEKLDSDEVRSSIARWLGL